MTLRRGRDYYQNMKYLRILLPILATFFPAFCEADIFKYTDADGVVHFSNVQGGGQYSLYLKEGPQPPPEVVSNPRISDTSKEWMYSYADTTSRNLGLSPALIRAIIKAESNGNRKALSPKGAQGIMQLMPFTAGRFKVKDPYDPVQNIEGGVRYIRELLDEFDGNVAFAVAAYNAGPAAVRKHKGIPPYSETRTYVRRVLDHYRLLAAKE